MPRVRCLYFDCIYLEEDICTASFVTFDPDSGCEMYDNIAPSHSDEDTDEEDDFENWVTFEDEPESEDSSWFGEDSY